MYKQPKIKTASGFTLIEVLIAVLVLSIGLLGLASLQAASLKNNYSAYMRSQAAILANDMADRIRANAGTATTAGSALNGGYNNIDIGPGELGTIMPTNCIVGTCNSTQIRDFDIIAWGVLLNNALPGAAGSVVGVGPMFTVTVMWDDEKRGIAGKGCSGNLTVDMACFAITFML